MGSVYKKRSFFPIPSSPYLPIYYPYSLLTTNYLLVPIIYFSNSLYELSDTLSIKGQTS